MKKLGLLSIFILTLTIFSFAQTSVVSIRQVTDVKPTDGFYADLQSLIERYGINNLTRDYKFNPNGQLESIDYMKLAAAGKNVLKELAINNGISESKLETVWGKNCVTKENVFVMKETVISKWLGCLYGVGDISAEAKDVLMTRGKFALYLNTALNRGVGKISSLIPPKTSPTPAPTPVTTPAPNNNWIKFLSAGTEKMKQKDYDGAIRSFSECLTITKALLCYQNRATAYGLKKDYSSALKDLDEAIKLNSEDPDLLNLRSNIRIKLIDGKDRSKTLNLIYAAIEDLSEAIKLDSKNPQRYLDRAKINCAIDNKKEAGLDEGMAKLLGGKVTTPCQ